LFCRSYFGGAFSGSAAWYRSYFQPNQEELEVVFQIIFWQAFSGSAALKVPVLLSTEPRELEVVSDHIA
jgi:hypothetical protein